MLALSPVLPEISRIWMSEQLATWTMERPPWYLKWFSYILYFFVFLSCSDRFNHKSLSRSRSSLIQRLRRYRQSAWGKGSRYLARPCIQCRLLSFTTPRMSCVILQVLLSTRPMSNTKVIKGMYFNRPTSFFLPFFLPSFFVSFFLFYLLSCLLAVFLFFVRSFGAFFISLL